MGISGNDLVGAGVSFRIREAEPADLKEIYSIEKRSFSDPWTPSQILFEIVYRYSKGFVIEIEGRVVAFIFAMIVSDEAHIGDFAVDPDFRRRGLGEKLLRYFLDFAKERGVKRVVLEVRKSNLPARGLYEKCGFREVGVRKRYYKNGEDAIVMERVLENEG